MKKILIITSDEKYYNKIENDVIKGNHQFFWVANIKEANKKIKAIAFDIMVLDQEDLTQKVCFSFIMKIANNTSFEKNPTIDFVIFYNRKNLKEIRGYASFVTRAFIKGTEKKIILSLLKDNDKALAKIGRAHV